MNQLLKQTLAKFLLPRYDPNRPLLLAFSGGPDSLTLLHLLLEFRQKRPLKLGLAHVDHGWRPESRQEAETLQKMAAELDLPFHLKELNPTAAQGNLEAACREARLQFFKELCAKHNYQAVLLAHHADDLAETVLKRTLEGVALPYLSGMSPETLFLNIKLWRPFLNTPKQDLLNWLKKKGLKGFYDSTNEDPRFLRGKFRTSIIPWLSSQFGKEIAPALTRLSAEAAELRDYLNEKIAPLLSRVVTGPFGSMLDLNNCGDFSLQNVFETKHLIRCFCEYHGFSLSRDGLEKAAYLLVQGAANKCIEADKHQLLLDRGHLFILKEDISPSPLVPLDLTLGEIKWGPWTLQITSSNTPIDICYDWKRLWHDCGAVTLPKGNYTIASPIPHANLINSSTSLAKWWTDHRVPCFIRDIVPVIYKEKSVLHEFLTGKQKNFNKKADENDFFSIKIFIQKKVSC